MAQGHVCDECMTVAPIDGALHWWEVTSIENMLKMGEKEEYHFCSWRCLTKYGKRRADARA